jgi:hypothetical protein
MGVLNEAMFVISIYNISDTDTRGYVKKFLEEDEPEPSEGDTLSSLSSCSYPTLYSDYEDDSVQDDLSADDQDCRPTGRLT